MSRDLFILITDTFSMRTSVLKGGYGLTKSAKYDQNEIMNRSSPVITYANSSAMVFSIGLDLVALQSADQEVSSVVKTLLSLVFPVQPGVKPPALCKITAGTILQSWPCVCESVDNHIGEYGVWDINDNNPMNALVSLRFIGVETDNVPASQWIASSNIQDIGIPA